MAAPDAAAAQGPASPAQVPLRRPAGTPCFCCPGQTDPGLVPSRRPAVARQPARSRCCGHRARRQVQVPSPVPAQAPQPATIPHCAGRRRIPDPPPAMTRWFWGWHPAAARRPARSRCSAGWGGPPQQTGNRPAGLPRTVRPRKVQPRTVQPRTVRHRRTGRRHRWGRRTAAARTARPCAFRLGQTVPGRPALVLVLVPAGPARTAKALAARRRTGLAGTRLVPVRDFLGRTQPGRQPTVAPGLGRPAPAAVPVRRLASQARTGPPTAAPPRTVRGRHDQQRRLAPHLVARVLARRPPSPVRTGIRMPAHSGPLPVASRAPARRAPVPVCPVPVRGKPAPDTPVPADSQGGLVPDNPALDTQAQAPRQSGRSARPDQGPVDTARALAHRRIPRAGARGGAPGAADLVQVRPAGGGDRSGVAGDGQRRAWSPRDAARAGRKSRDRTRPAWSCGAGIRALAACRRAPAGSVTVLAVCPQGGDGRAPCCLHSPGSRGQRDRRLLPGRRLAGKRRAPRRRRPWPGRTCLGQARCPDDSPGTS
jgi:hypothetical protein